MATNKNLIEIKKDYAILIIKNKYGLFNVFIDIEDVENIKDIKWGVQKRSNFYVEGYKNNKIILLHRFLVDCPKNKVVDHINRNTLDNRKSNLRICNKAENNYNQGVFKSNKTTGIKGVCWNKSRKKYQAHISKDGKNYSKRFIKLEDAINWRTEMELHLFGEYSRIEVKVGEII